MKIKTILFDFDYTLADSSRGVFECVNYALERMGLPKFSYADVCKTIGLSLPNTYFYLTHRDNEDEIKKFKNLFIERADQVMVENTRIFDVVPQTLKKLKAFDITLGIVSTKFRHRIKSILKRENLLDYFHVIVGGEDVVSHKPDPEGLLLALSKLAVLPENCIFVGDSRVDGELSVRGKIKFVGVCTGTTKREEFNHYFPLFVCDTIEQLPDYLIKKNMI
ncbi:HAD-IA family hydrolase [candidate division KSB1 bacterium]|nr:HAD-IA family hydrolase [candidate division KSB1 bacterium]